MSKFVQMYRVNTQLNSMSDKPRYLEDYVTKHLEKYNELQVKQVEYCGGDSYGMYIIVVYELATPPIKGKE